MKGIPDAWMREADCGPSFIPDPAKRARELCDLAMAARRRGEVDDQVLAEMLEIADAGMLWALDQLDEGYWLGILKHEAPAQAIEGTAIRRGPRAAFGGMLDHAGVTKFGDIC